MAGGIVNNEEDFAPSVHCPEALEEGPERLPVEHIGKPVRKARIVETDRREQVCCFALTIRVDSGLAADPCPRSVKCAIEPEARFVFEQDYATAGCGFFLIRGKVVCSQCAWRSWSARASRFRGRCTENPSLCSKRGT